MYPPPSQPWSRVSAKGRRADLSLPSSQKGAGLDSGSLLRPEPKTQGPAAQPAAGLDPLVLGVQPSSWLIGGGGTLSFHESLWSLSKAILPRPSVVGGGSLLQEKEFPPPYSARRPGHDALVVHVDDLEEGVLARLGPRDALRKRGVGAEITHFCDTAFFYYHYYPRDGAPPNAFADRNHKEFGNCGFLQVSPLESRGGGVL